MAAFGTDEWLVEAQAEIGEHSCPRCGEVGTLSVDREMVAQQLGTYSLSGTTMKVSAVAAIIMSCEGCGLAGRLHE
jgi:hypothetical protein